MTPAELIARLRRAHKTFNTIPHRQPEADLFGEAAAALEAAQAGPLVEEKALALRIRRWLFINNEAIDCEALAHHILEVIREN